MPDRSTSRDSRLSRRSLLALAGAGCVSSSARAAGVGKAMTPRFQIGCMTYVYRDFPLQRAIDGIALAGYRFIAWGTEHLEAPGRRVPVLAKNAPEGDARRLGDRCREAGLEPVLMFSTVYPEHPDALNVLKRRIEQAHAGGVPQVLTFGHTEGDGERLWMERFAALEPLARQARVMLVIKQHGGDTGSGVACARFTRKINSPWIKVNYDAGNVMDYLNVDPIPDLKASADEVRSFCIKDHRNFPRDEDCGPGFGEIDHYQLLSQIAQAGEPLPLCCENIFEPLLPRPAEATGVDALARRAREYLESVTRGLRTYLRGSGR